MIPDFHSRPFARLRKPELRLGLGLGVLAGGSNSGPAVTFDFLAESTFDSRIAFTRGSAATRVNAAGIIEVVGNNVPRFDYDPVTLEMRGLLIEEPRTNYLIQSEFATGLPASRGGLVSTTTFSGLIGATGIAFGYDGTASSYFYVTNYAVPANSLRVISVFVRMDDGGAPVFGNNAGQHPDNDFTLNLGGTVLAPTIANSGKVENYGGGLYRVSLAISTSASPSSNCGVVKYTANSVRTFKVSGIMVEAGTDVTSYIPTTTAQVTRAADVAVVSGTSFAGWYNQAAGSVIVAFDRNPAIDGTDRGAISLDVGSASSRMVLYSSTVGRMLGASSGTTIFSFINLGSMIAGTRYSMALAYALDDFAACMSGGTLSTDSSGMPPTASQMTIGGGPGTSALNGHIRSVTYYNRRLPNADLQRLTA
ncbi:hypothetical protein Swit_4466 [Rhizorhabdus wittichii RW1]|uniref:Uncharacterized protein n=1 Tax=Rhizorhabdus wittichii (strain DSM 6014 / CCUG 31198 / JCM 15750 / NBRC 105917 / EY 4224 / RW1) TaxID=392499 RepID=A0A9J9LFS0_RHIWR|nr:hypothetical protein Swit_4466 [Rhizorhabdus wittichii RW1]